MSLHLQQLYACSLPTDWMTISVGFEGIELAWGTARLMREDVQTYALDRLADAAGTVDEEPTFLLADADLTDWNALQQPLALLAERSGVSCETALRKWRDAALWSFIHTFQIPPPGADDWAAYESWMDFEAMWGNLISDPPLPDGPTKWTGLGIDDFLNRCRAYLDDERQALRG